MLRLLPKNAIYSQIIKIKKKTAQKTLPKLIKLPTKRPQNGKNSPKMPLIFSAMFSF